MNLNKIKIQTARGFSSVVIFVVAIIFIDWIEGSGAILQTISQWWNSFD